MTQEQAEADRDGMRVFEEMVWITDRTKPKTPERGGGATGIESWPAHGHLPPHEFEAPPSIHSHHVSPL